MVDAVGIEELRHVRESAHPPQTVVFEHLVPVIGGESPVLSVGREIIWGSTSLSVQVEVARLLPSITAIAVHADGDITFEDDATTAGIAVNLAHLGVQQVLNEIEERHLLIYSRARRGEGIAIILVPCVMVGPLGVVGRSIQVAQVAILGVRHQPLFVLLEEFLVFGRGHDLLPLLGEEQFQISRLGFVHAFIVNLCQGIQFLSQLFETFPFLGVSKGGKVLQTDILGMEGKDADSGIGI